MKLLTNPICPFAQRAWLALLETNTSYEEIIVSLKEKTPFFTETYLKALGADLKSDGKVPVLIDGDFILTESAVIADYVAASAKDTTILPSTPLERARAAIWADQIVGKFIPAFYGLLMCKDETAVPAKKVALEAAAAAAGTFLASSPSPGPFVLGARISLSDFLLWPFVERLCTVEHYRAFSMPVGSPGLDSFASWCAACRANKSVVATKQDRELFIEGYRSYAT